MKLRQTRLNTSTASVPSRLEGEDVCADAKTCIEAVTGGAFAANPARSNVAAQASPAVADSPQPKRIAALRSGAVAGRISAAALAAAHRVSRFHAEAWAARTVPPKHAEPGAGRASSVSSHGRPDAMCLLDEAVSLPSTLAAV